MGEGLQRVCYETDIDSTFSADKVDKNIPLDGMMICGNNFTFILSLWCKNLIFEGGIGLTL
jgi:hypothetical protein